MSIRPKLPMIAASLLLPAAAEPVIPGWNETSLGYSRIQNLGFDISPGNLAISDSILHAPLPAASTAIPGLELDTAFEFRSTILTFNDVPTTLPVDTGQLETFSVYPTLVEFANLAMFTPTGSSWVFGLWTRAQLATDFRELDGDDISIDAAGGFGYRFTDHLLIGTGVAAMDFNGHFLRYLPGVALDWTLNEQIRIQSCGLEWRATYAPCSIWEFSIRSDATGEIWNIADDEGISRFIDLTSYRIGAFASFLVAESLRVEMGIGGTFGNEIRLRQPDGRTTLKQGLDDGWYAQLGLTFRF